MITFGTPFSAKQMLILFGGEGSTVWSQTNSQIHLGNILLNKSTIHSTGYSCQIELSISLHPSDLRAYLLRQMCKSAQTATNIILPPHCTNALCGVRKVYFSAQPNNLKLILNFQKYYPIEHIFVPACSSVRKIHFFKF